MNGAFRLDNREVERVLARYCTVDDCRVALWGYPGPETDADVDWTGALTRVLRNCVQVAAQQDHAASFMLRMIAGCWNRREPRADLLNLRLYDLVRPAKVIDKPIGPLAAAFGALAAKAAIPPACETLECVFEALSEEGRTLLGLLAREAEVLDELARSLRETAALKLLHDRLHAFQVMSDQILNDEARASVRLATLIDLTVPGLHRDLDALPPAGVECRDRCDRLLRSVADLLRGGAADMGFVRALLDRMLRIQMPQVDLLLFEAVRNWPLKKAVALLDEADRLVPGLDYDRASVFDLHDTLLRRLLAHRLWQDADLAVYDIEELLDELPEDWLAGVYRRASELRTYLLALGAAPSPAEGLSSGFLSQLHLISFRDEDDADRRLPELRRAFAETRERVRLNFIEVDGWLKQDFLRLDVLRASLEALLASIPEPLRGAPWLIPT